MPRFRRSCRRCETWTEPVLADERPRLGTMNRFVIGPVALAIDLAVNRPWCTVCRERDDP